MLLARPNTAHLGIGSKLARMLYHRQRIWLYAQVYAVEGVARLDCGSRCALRQRLQLCREHQRTGDRSRQV